MNGRKNTLHAITYEYHFSHLTLVRNVWLNMSCFLFDVYAAYGTFIEPFMYKYDMLRHSLCKLSKYFISVYLSRSVSGCISLLWPVVRWFLSCLRSSTSKFIAIQSICCVFKSKHHISYAHFHNLCVTDGFDLIHISNTKLYSRRCCLLYFFSSKIHERTTTTTK